MAFIIGIAMRCRVCGGLLEPRVTDLPFKIGDSSIVILKALPVLQCRQCGERSSNTRPCFASTKSSPASIRPPNWKSSASQPDRSENNRDIPHLVTTKPGLENK